MIDFFWSRATPGSGVEGGGGFVEDNGGPLGVPDGDGAEVGG